jgi:glutaredoxin
LAVGPDGRCVLCRQTPFSRRPEPRAQDTVTLAQVGRVLAWCVGALVLVSIGRAALRSKGTITGASDLQATAPFVAPPAQPAVAEEPLRPAPEIARVASTAPWPPPMQTPEEVPAGPANGDSATRRQTEPGEQELRIAMRRVSVTMYSTSWCPVCRRARDWLQRNGISFEERDVEKSEDAHRAQLARNARGGVPTIDVDGTVLVGFSAESLQAALQRAAARRAKPL